MNVVKDQSVVDKEKAGTRKGKVSPFCGIRGAEGVSDGFCQKEMALCLDQI